ncbi:DUF499 domain-containing protein [uncultured Arcticibacterium sp.]|uniref:DUF499 domain-containing protein n=1 Tax=uncultured Arcticibacterium sp. TaxID=2173042 RepID=UPI0030F4C8AD
MQQDNLYKAFSLFIEAFRPYTVSILMKEVGDKWPDMFFDSLYPNQKEHWEMGLRSGSQPESLVDYPYLKGFVLKYKDLLRDDFGRDVNKLATQLETINEIRNKMAHFQSITSDEYNIVFINMKRIMRAVKMEDLETELAHLHEAKEEIKPVPKKLENSAELQPWFVIANPHIDIKTGRLDESVFAANLAEVALGNGREIYRSSTVFFEKTFFTAGLKNIARTVVKGLNGTEDGNNTVISLQTGFGGGKTHTLISLFHVAKNGKKLAESTYAKELINYTSLPQFEEANVAVFTNTTNDAANGRMTTDNIRIQTIWGELAYQLGGKDAYEIVRLNDEQFISPGGLFKKVLEKCTPALILIDELADYCVKASARSVGKSNLSEQTISFMQELTEAVASTNNCVAVITLPASPQEVGNTPEAQSILNSLQKRVSRVGADTQPVADDEIYEVIRRRLFENIGDQKSLEQVASKYMELYEQHFTELPGHAVKTQYKEKILKSYPFHPELIDIFRVKWASHHDFQRTRGVLRLLAAIVSDLWSRQNSLRGENLLIHPGQVNFANLDALSGQLKKLYGNGYDSVITADVAGSSSNAFKIDGNKAEYGGNNLTQSLSSVILMNSFGNEGANKGISVPELKLSLLTPRGFNHNNVNGALDELESNAYYLYYAQAGGASKRYWFNTKPNINILINKAKGDIKDVDITAEIIDRLTAKSKNVQFFNTLVNPSEDIPEQTKPTLLILSPQHLANPNEVSKTTKALIEKIATKKGNSERIYRNTILFLLCSEVGISRLQTEVREYLACNKISSEYQGQLEKEQREDLKKRMNDASQQSEVSLVPAYSLVAKYSVKSDISTVAIKQFKDSIDSQINTTVLSTLMEEEWLLESIGLNTLRKNNLLPTAEQSVKAKDIYEAFLRFDDKPMITNAESVTQSLRKYCENGAYTIATGEGEQNNFTRYFFQESVPFFDVKDETYWLIDNSLRPVPKEQVGGDSISEKEETPLTVPTSTTLNVAAEPAHASDRNIKSLTVSGKVALENYTQLFNSFIMPLAQNNIEIEIKIKANSTAAKPLTDASHEYKIVKESAKQLGLNFEEE